MLRDFNTNNTNHFAVCMPSAFLTYFFGFRIVCMGRKSKK